MEKHNLTQKALAKEDISIEDLHEDLEKKLQEQGFVLDKKNFILQDQHLTFTQRIADSVTGFIGSWIFIIIFCIFLFLWFLVNIYLLVNKAFDPFPFILLNLILSCLAAIQAPMILMSQNREAQREKKQQEINIQKDMVDFKQDRLDLILDQKEWSILRTMDLRLKRIEEQILKQKTKKEK